MSLTRLNNIKVLHIHKHHTDKLSLVDIGNKFVGGLVIVRPSLETSNQLTNC